MNQRRLILSLFSGAGGLDLGFEQAGFQPGLAIDANSVALATYRRNHLGVRAEQLDLLQTGADEIVKLWQATNDQPPLGVIGGPPCQTFSQGNVHIRPDDVRRQLPLRYAEILARLNEVFHLRFFVFENVAGLKTTQHRQDYEKFLSKFQEAGFCLFEAILDAQFYGVAQRRRRLFVVGLNQKDFPSAKFHFPEPPVLVQHLTVEMKIGDLPEPVLFRRGIRSEDIPFHPNHWAMSPRSRKFQDPANNPNGLRGRSFRVLSWNAPSLTVAYGNREVHIHPNGHRRLSVYEAMQLQGFPHSYILEGTLSAQIRQVADAVPPPLGKCLAGAVAAFLDGAESIGDTPVTLNSEAMPSTS